MRGPDPCRTPRDASGHCPQRDSDGDRGLRVWLHLPGAGARLSLARGGDGGSQGSHPPSPRACVPPRAPQRGVTPFALPTELLSRRQPQPLPVASGPAGTPRSVPALILGGRVSPPAPLSLCPCLAAPGVPRKASQFGLVPFIGGQWGGTWGKLRGSRDWRGQNRPWDGSGMATPVCPPRVTPLWGALGRHLNANTAPREPQNVPGRP